jgi:hypothetical protein
MRERESADQEEQEVCSIIQVVDTPAVNTIKEKLN